MLTRRLLTSTGTPTAARSARALGRSMAVALRHPAGRAFTSKGGDVASAVRSVAMHAGLLLTLSSAIAGAAALAV
jgi:hypothetical protein